MRLREVREANLDGACKAESLNRCYTFFLQEKKPKAQFKKYFSFSIIRQAFLINYKFDFSVPINFYYFGLLSNVCNINFFILWIDS